MVWNQGVTFGLFKADGVWGPLLLVGVAVAIVAALAVWLRRAETRLVAVSLGAIAGGAAGNVLDRLRFGAVVDFIHVHVGGLELVCVQRGRRRDRLRCRGAGAGRVAARGPAPRRTACRAGSGGAMTRK